MPLQSSPLPWFLVALVTAILSGRCRSAAEQTQSPNILFIAIDDMNDWTGFLGGHPQAKTPNLDKIARRGVNFTNAHCSAPACSPSRLALLYGVQPFHTGFYPFYDHKKLRAAGEIDGLTSLPKRFRDAGYQAFGAGKIFHGSVRFDDDWDGYLTQKPVKLKYDASQGYQIGDSQKMAFCPTTDPPEVHPDHQVADYGIEILNESHEQPFFLAVGIVKPHLAFVCPEAFFDAHSERIKPPLIRHKDLQDVPWVGRSMARLSDDLKFRGDEAWEKVQRAYLACITWADFNIGRILGALDSSPHADNTIVVIWSDHGYHLGEKRSFRKFSLWEESTRVPLIIYDPRIHETEDNGNCDAAVSLIDIYPTLMDLVGLSKPVNLDGTSLVPQLIDASSSRNVPAITSWGRGNYAVRSNTHRLIRYFDGGEELYDHRVDPQEWNNLADDAASADVAEELRKHLPGKEAPLVRSGLALWNVIDADRPNRLDQFKEQTWPKMSQELKPKIE